MIDTLLVAKWIEKAVDHIQHLVMIWLLGIQNLLSD